MNKYLSEKYFALVMGITAFLYYSYAGLTRERIESEDDLTEIQGKFVKYSFKDRTGYKRIGHQYYIWIEGYINAFQVKADYLRIFKARAFASQVAQGDILRFTIPKTHLDRLDTDNNVFVTSIGKRRIVYLDQDEVIKIENELASSYGDFILAGGFLIVGLVVFMRKR